MALVADILAFFGFGGAMSPKRIAQATKLACNPFAQPEVRMRELQRLLKERTPASLAGAIRRFSANAQGHIADEEEKQWLMDALVDLGEEALPPLQDYIRDGQKLTYSLLAHRRIAGDIPTQHFFLQVLCAIGPKEHQRVESKQQLVRALVGDAHEHAVLEGLTPFLKDHSDDVIWAVLDGVEHALDEAQNARGSLHQALVLGLRELLTEPSASARIGHRVAQLLTRYGAPITPLARALPSHLAEHYFVDGKGIVHARASA